MLGKNIAGVVQQEYGVSPSASEILLSAYNSGGGSVQAAPPLSIPVTQVQTNYPVGGGNVDGTPYGSQATANIAVVSEDGVNTPASPAAGAAAVPLAGKVSPLVIAGVGLGALLLFGGKKKSVGGHKKSMLLPIAIAGGLAWWFFFRDKGSAANPEKDWLLNTFRATNQPNQDAMLAAIPSMNDADLHVLFIAAQAVANGTGLSAADTTAIDAMMSKYGLRGL